MARGRMLDKEISESDSFANLKDSNSQLLCVLLTAWWDDHGKMIGDEAWIKGNIVRKLHQFTQKKISKCLKNINDNLNVQWWVDPENGNKWLYWEKFDKFQTISDERKAKDRLPSPKIPKIPQEIPKNPQGNFGGCSPQYKYKFKYKYKYNINKAEGKKRPAVDKPVDNLLKAELDKILNDGFNIYSLINKIKKDSKVGAEIPAAVLKRVCRRYWEDKAKIKEPWPWFIAVVAREWRMAEHDELKAMPMAESIKDILGIK